MKPQWRYKYLASFLVSVAVASLAQTTSPAKKNTTGSASSGSSGSSSSSSSHSNGNATLEQAERALILQTLKEVTWVVSGPHGAATRLGMHRSTLQFRMKKLGIGRQVAKAMPAFYRRREYFMTCNPRPVDRARVPGPDPSRPLAYELAFGVGAA